MKVLIVGAGALGRVFGARLSAGGATVSALVKPRQRAAAERGYALWQLRNVQWDLPSKFAPVRVFTDPSEVAGDWDCVWLCVHASAFHDRWLDDLRARIGAASVVTLAQGVDDRRALEKIFPPTQILEVVPTVFAFEEHGSGERTLYWIPPGASLRVGGDRARAEPIIDALRIGGLAANHAGLRAPGPLLAALNIPYFAALETAGWSFPRLFSQLALPAAAAREASAAVAQALASAPLPAFATSRVVARIGLAGLRRLAPFDFDAYARRHFSKIGAQTREMLDGWIETAKLHGLPSEHIEQLRASLPELPTARRHGNSGREAQVEGTNAS